MLTGRWRPLLCSLAVAFGVVAATAGRGSAAGTLTIAAASDLQAALPELIARFERQSGIKSTVSFGSSGNFFAQIRNGAPFDVFFSADVDYPKQLIAAGDADPASLYEYATGRLVLWTRHDSGLDVSTGLPILRDARVRRIAIANPDHAPYGRAAVAALEGAGLYDAVQRKLVMGENIAQTMQLAESGNAEVGLVSLSLARTPEAQKSGGYTEVATTSYPPIRQAVVIVTASANKIAARALLDYLKTADARGALQSFGFDTPAR
jgi:molybdate transport system substrate-binding protein